MISGCRCAGRARPGQQVQPDCRGDGSLAGAHAQFAAEIGDVEIDGAFADAPDASEFPTGLALRHPVKAVLFTRGQSLHGERPSIAPAFSMKADVSKCMIACRFVGTESGKY